MGIVISILVFIAIILVIVLAHEAGHFFSAKKFGIRVDEFGFGFPPKIYGKKYGETEYTVNALPFGGFVKIFGEDPNEENTNGPDSGRSFVNKPKWQQAIVLFAGIFANFILAWALFSLVYIMGSPFATNSIPESIKEKMVSNLIVVGIVKESPAYLAGIKEGDKIISMETNIQKIVNPSVEDIRDFSNQPEKTILVRIERKGKEFEVSVMPKENKDLGRAFIGISPGVLLSGRFGVIDSIKYGLETSLLYAKDTVISLGQIFRGGEKSKEVRDSMIGPVGLVAIINIILKLGPGYLISFMAIISMSLAIINLVPFPALDGGRLLFVLIEKIKGSKLNTKFANYANMIGFGILIILMLLVTYQDIVKLF